MAKKHTKPAVNSDDESTGDFWRAMKDADKSERTDNRQVAQIQFPQARAFAKEHGFELIKHSDVHYKIKTSAWTFEVYPSNGRIWTSDHSAPILIRHMPVCWNLLDVVHAVFKELEKLPKKEPVAPIEQNDVSLSEATKQFRNASVMAAAHHFRLSKQGNAFKATAAGWTLELHPESQEIVRVDDKGPHLELPEQWTLMDAVKAIIKKLEK